MKANLKADIRLIRLIRKGVIEKQQERLPEENRQYYFATDYFDIVQVEQKELEDSAADFLDIGREEIYEHETAAQSYALYCSKEMMHRYESSEQNGYRKNPFEKKTEMEYLSFIHIYITPEIMARMDYDSNELWNSDVVMQSFADDIYQVLDLFQRDHTDNKFVARLYLMLSAGDYAVVVRSEKPEVSYYLSTYLRKREAGKKSAAEESSGYMIYKTYTLLTIENQVVYREEGSGARENYFVLRGCYANKYWKEQHSMIESAYDAAEEFYPMSGRYDFTARLTEQEFFQIMPDIVGNGNRNTEKQRADHTEKEGTKSSLVQYLSYLIKNGYLSYLNERYLMGQQDTALQNRQQSVSQFIGLTDEGIKREDLFNRNEKRIDMLLKEQEKMAKDVLKIRGYRKQIKQNMFLIKKQILICRCINELSDTRVYASILAEQLEVVLSSVERFIKWDRIQEGDKDALDFLEDYLRKSVWTLDSYAQYVRNNNLQSLQAPNYHIETSMGMEKILIGYSEMLWKFMVYYQEEIDQGKMKDYLPIMVPDLYNREVNVEVMFPEMKSLHIQNCGSEKGKTEKYLMVVGSSSMEEISDFPVMIASLFHEVAHQFRYESREKRNNTLLEPAVGEVMKQTASEITAAANEIIGASVDETGAFRRGFAYYLTIGFLKCRYMKKEDGFQDCLEFQNESLERFKQQLALDINAFFSEWTEKPQLELRIKEFIKEVSCGVVITEAEFLGKVKQLESVLKKDGKEALEEIKEWAFQLTVFCAQKCLNKDSTCNETDTDKNGKGKKAGWQTRWENHFSGCSSKDIQRLWKTFSFFEFWMDGYKNDLETYKGDVRHNGGEIEVFEDILYQNMKKYWNEMMERSKEFHNTIQDNDEKNKEKEERGIPSYRYWSLIGRYMGLDYGSKEKFIKRVKYLMRQSTNPVRMTLIGWYREESADLLMCNIVDMKPTGYLNLVARQIIQNKRYEMDDIKRIFCVLYVHRCYEKEDKEGSWDRFREMCCGIYRDVKSNFYKAYCNNPDRQKRNTADPADRKRTAYIPAELKREMQDFLWKDDNENTRQSLQKRILDEMRTMDVILEQEKDTAQKKNFEDQVRNAKRIYDILAELIQHGRAFWSEWNVQEKILEDLAYGDFELKKLNERMCVSEETSVRRLSQIGKKIAEYLDQPFFFLDKEKRGELNQVCIDMLLRMYYDNKIRKAQESAGEQS